MSNSNTKAQNDHLETSNGIRVRDLSVNRANVTINDAGKLVLRTNADLPEHYEFNGGSNAWKAIAGLRDYNNDALEDLSLSFEWSGTAPEIRVYVNLLVDAQVINGEPIAGETSKDELILVTDITNGGGVDHTITFDPNNFMIVGYRKGSSGSWYGQSFSLADLSPNARLKDKKSDDNGMPSNIKLNGVMIILGDTTTQEDMDATIDELNISPAKP